MAFLVVGFAAGAKGNKHHRQQTKNRALGCALFAFFYILAVLLPDKTYCTRCQVWVRPKAEIPIKPRTCNDLPPLATVALAL